MLPLDVSGALWPLGAGKFLCYRHLGTELFVDFTGKMSATIRGYYVWYFSVAKKELVQTEGNIDCSIFGACYGREVPTEVV